MIALLAGLIVLVLFLTISTVFVNDEIQTPSHPRWLLMVDLRLSGRVALVAQLARRHRCLSEIKHAHR
jgi:hypothetical protein